VPQGIHGPFARLGWRIVYYTLPASLQLDSAELKARFSAAQPDIVVLIHQFGAYVPHNVKLLRDLCTDGTLLLEDFAHTVWDSQTVLSGDLCGFSFTKTLGVASGSVLWLNNKSLLGTDAPGAIAAADRRLNTLLKRQLAVESLCAATVRSRLLQAALLRLSAWARAYYPFLSAHYPDLHGRPDRDTLSLLEHIDTDRVSARRRQIAMRYSRELDKRLLLPLPPEHLERQSLFGFPVLVANRERFHGALYHRGVRGLILCDRWWFDTSSAPGELYQRHYLLPLSHYMSDTDVDRVIEAAAEALEESR
jgi:dTDP-4-amino-4,6-dideoxygalactose transaminase